MKIRLIQPIMSALLLSLAISSVYAQTNPVTPPTTPVVNPNGQVVVNPTGQVVNPNGQVVVSPTGQVVNPNGQVVVNPNGQVVVSPNGQVSTPSSQPPAANGQVIGPNGQVVTATTIPAGSPTAMAMRNSGVKRPTDSLGVAEIDQYVTQCYNFYDQTNLLSYRLGLIEQETMVNKTSDMDTKKIDDQLDDYKAQLLNLHTVGAALLLSGSTMTDKATNDLKTRPLRIPGAIVRVHNSTKAVNISLQNIYTMTTVTMVNIKKKLNVAAATAAPAGNAPVSNLQATGKTIKTAVSITGISFGTFNTFSAELKTMQGIKNMEKKFNASGTSVIELEHYGTTDDLLSAMLYNCKDVVSEKNIGGSEKGKITLTFQN